MNLGRGARPDRRVGAADRRPRPRVEARRLFLPLCCALVWGAGCRPDMFDQPKFEPLERSEFFRDQRSARSLPAHTVARGHLDEDEMFYSGKIGTNFTSIFPFPVTREVLKRGQERFDIYCAVCHGRTGEGRGMIVQRGFPQPPSFQIERLRQAPVGYFYEVMTRGYGVMYPQAPRVAPHDRWAIGAYIRALQLSRSARLEEAPPEERIKLEAGR